MIPFYFDVFSSIKKHVEYTLGQQHKKIKIVKQSELMAAT